MAASTTATAGSNHLPVPACQGRESMRPAQWLVYPFTFFSLGQHAVADASHAFAARDGMRDTPARSAPRKHGTRREIRPAGSMSGRGNGAWSATLPLATERARNTRGRPEPPRHPSTLLLLFSCCDPLAIIHSVVPDAAIRCQSVPAKVGTRQCSHTMQASTWRPQGVSRISCQLAAFAARRIIRFRRSRSVTKLN